MCFYLLYNIVGDNMVLDIEKAKQGTLEIINKKSFSLVRPEFNTYDPVYTFTTENLSYLEKIKGEKALTVTGSFDQTLNLVYEGSKEIDNYDVNLLTVFFSGLKYSAMKCLDYEEYINFFIGENSYNYETYMKLRPYLSNIHQQYWDFVYQLFEKNNEALRNSRLLYKPGSLEQVINSNPYLKSKKAYNKTKENLDNVKITFLEKNLMELDEDKKYDLILTSNIETYLVEDIFSPLKEEEYVDFIKNKLSKNLNKGGIIQIAYQYYYKTKLRVSSQFNFYTKYKVNKIDYLEEFKKIIIDARPLSTLARMDGIDSDCIYYYKQK